MSNTYCTNISLIDKTIREEPENFYNVTYKILKEDCNEYDISYFKHFYIVRRIPLYNNGTFGEEIKLIENFIETLSDEVKNRILNALKEVKEGHGNIENFNKNVFTISKYNILTCGHITHNISHLVHGLNNGIDVKDFDLIMEFGGGYGGMAKLCHDMGYKNTYYMYDLQEIRPIQSYYLTVLNVDHKIMNEYNELEDVDYANKNTKKLFIATWSLSEVDFDLREKILQIIKDFDAVIITYQRNIWNRDNGKYFEEGGIFRNNFNKINSWSNINMPFLKWDGGNYYLIGNNLR